MNYALIFAGGTGSRMNSELPKQFLEVNHKPILVYTLEKFQNSPIIDRIVVVCLKNYIDYVHTLIKKFSLDKVSDVICGGETAFSSQRIGVRFIQTLSKNHNDILFIHDGVRPFIDEATIEKCYQCVLNESSAVTISPAFETIAILDNLSKIKETVPRQSCMLARAPQVFYVKDIFLAHRRAFEEGKEYIDSASMLLDQGKKLNVVEGPVQNIKITTQFDYELCKLLLGKKDE